MRPTHQWFTGLKSDDNTSPFNIIDDSQGDTEQILIVDLLTLVRCHEQEDTSCVCDQYNNGSYGNSTSSSSDQHFT